MARCLAPLLFFVETAVRFARLAEMRVRIAVGSISLLWVAFANACHAGLGCLRARYSRGDMLVRSSLPARVERDAEQGC